MDVDSRPTGGMDRISGPRYGLGKTLGEADYRKPGRTSFLEMLANDDTLLKPRTWAGSHHGSGFKHMDDVEPSGKVPAPSKFHTDYLHKMEPDPLLTVTPEKSIGLRRLGKDPDAGAAGTGVKKISDSGDLGIHDVSKKLKPRVHFAPGTRLSPSDSSVGGNLPGTNDSRITDDGDDTVPRSFADVSERLYQPGKYADSESDGERSPTTEMSSSKAPLQRYTVASKDNKTVYVPLQEKHSRSKSLGTDVYDSKPVTAKIVKHLSKASSVSKTRKFESELKRSALDTEIKDAFEGGCFSSGRSGKYDTRSSSTSPFDSEVQTYCKTAAGTGSISPKLCRRSPTARPRSTSPSRPRSTSPPRPSSSDKHRAPSLLTHEREKPSVAVVREAPRPQSDHDYKYPFNKEDSKASDYDPDLEHPFARPEFNSALKISEDLRSVKERKPDTWGVVSKTLHTSSKKRMEIQEKAFSRVNVESKAGLFTGLVDIDVPLDAIRQSIEQEKMLQAPLTKPVPAKVPIGKEPDIMEFFPADFQRELPDLTLTGIQPITESLLTANPILAFDLYRHNRAWNGIQDS